MFHCKYYVKAGRAFKSLTIVSIKIDFYVLYGKGILWEN
jgi:hypothetical protein